MNKHDKYYKHDGEYIIPIKIFNELMDKLEKFKILEEWLDEERKKVL